MGKEGFSIDFQGNDTVDRRAHTPNTNHNEIIYVDPLTQYTHLLQLISIHYPINLHFCNIHLIYQITYLFSAVDGSSHSSPLFYLSRQEISLLSNSKENDVWQNLLETTVVKNEELLVKNIRNLILQSISEAIIF